MRAVPSGGVIDHGLTRHGVVQLRRRWPAAEPWAAMLLVHGLDDHSGRYAHVGGRLSRAGIDVVAIDLPGFGGSGGARADIGAFDDYVDDVADQLEQVRRLGLPTVLLGHSMGGLVSLLVALQRPWARPDAMVLTAPALDARVPVALRRAAPLVARVVPRLSLPTLIRGGVLTHDREVARAYVTDPVTVRTVTPRLGVELFAAMAWATAHVAELDVATLVLHGGGDRLVPTPSSEPLGRVTGVERRVLPGLRHEVLNEPGKEALLDEIAEWIRARVAPPVGRSA
jgi:alpha-beta hydrolase superfamily lysophospholipase